MNSLLSPGSSPLERRLAQTCSGISDLQVSLRDLWNPSTCPVRFLPYLAWAFSVDRWDESWTESVKRRVVQDAFYIHQHKGTTSAVRRVVEPFGFLIRIIEWWQTGETPGMFRLDIGVQELPHNDNPICPIASGICNIRSPRNPTLCASPSCTESRSICASP